MSGQTLMEAGIILIASCVLGAVIIFALGISNDLIESEFAANGFFDVPAHWGNAVDHTIPSRGIYLIGYGLPIFGVVNFLYVASRRQRYDVERVAEEYE